MVRRVANFLITSRQLIGRVGRVEFGERVGTTQADKPAADRRSTKFTNFWSNELKQLLKFHAQKIGEIFHGEVLLSPEVDCNTLSWWRRRK